MHCKSRRLQQKSPVVLGCENAIENIVECHRVLQTNFYSRSIYMHDLFVIEQAQATC